MAHSAPWLSEVGSFLDTHLTVVSGFTTDWKTNVQKAVDGDLRNESQMSALHLLVFGLIGRMTPSHGEGELSRETSK